MFKSYIISMSSFCIHLWVFVYLSRPIRPKRSAAPRSNKTTQHRWMKVCLKGMFTQLWNVWHILTHCEHLGVRHNITGSCSKANKLTLRTPRLTPKVFNHRSGPAAPRLYTSRALPQSLTLRQSVFCFFYKRSRNRNEFWNFLWGGTGRKWGRALSHIHQWRVTFQLSSGHHWLPLEMCVWQKRWPRWSI